MTPPKQSGPIDLRQYESPKSEVSVIEARSRAIVVNWGFVTIIVTLVLGISAYVFLDVTNHETNTLREWLQTTIAGEIGLLAGLLGSRNRG